MHASIRRGLQIALVVGGGLVFSAQAHADDTTGVDSILGGNQAVVAVEVPVTIAGNAVSVGGDSSSTDASTTSSTSGGSTAGENTTSGEDSLGGGNQVVAPVQVPVTVGGNAVSVIGDSSTADSSTTSGSTSGESAAGENTTSGEDSLGGGNQVVAPVQVPVTIGGNAVSVVGDSDTDTGASTGGSTPPVEVPTGPTVPTAPTEPTQPTVPASPSDPATPTHPGEVRDDIPAASRGGNVRTSPSGLAVMKPATAGLAYTGADAGALLGSAFLLLALGGLLLAGTRRRTMTG
jgi:hypothetical protein